MDPLYNNNPNPTPAPGPMPTPGNAMPNIASAPARSAAGPAPAPNQMPSMPTQSAAPSPVMEEVPAASMSFEQAFGNPAAPANNFGAAEPAAPAPAPAPQPADAIAAELAQPIQAAAPVPGSIGSAVSMPAAPAPEPAPAPMPEPAPQPSDFSEIPDDIDAFLNAPEPSPVLSDMGASVSTTKSNNVAFNPYSSNDTIEMTNAKKSFLPQFEDKNKLKYILIAAGAFLVFIIVVVAIMIAFSGNKNNSSDQSNEEEETVISGPTVVKSLQCSRDLTEADLISYADAKSGNELVEVGFGEKGTVVTYEQNIQLTYDDVATAKSAEAKIKTDRETELETYGLEVDPFTSSYGSQDSNLYLIRNAMPEDYNKDSFIFYGLDMDGKIESWQTSYEASGYTCKAETPKTTE